MFSKFALMLLALVLLSVPAAAQPATGVCSNYPNYWGCYEPATTVNIAAVAQPSAAATVPKFVYIGVVLINY